LFSEEALEPRHQIVDPHSRSNVSPGWYLCELDGRAHARPYSTRRRLVRLVR